eukprot:gnl/MRDRNA2_/MRDRNA2_72256_c0_seq1.p1 gnl/MRDRNA2_/MRDRNA2_72256_c0~~gnl/MRDRNA2_/MRDRNA2_72256_c0_seq1.p1  ORF type:complete len:132 (+),score=11.34 gnl/MRDRNA2_/MRDRNA2_72256_c0_seq1:59-397(+)
MPRRGRLAIASNVLCNKRGRHRRSLSSQPLGDIQLLHPWPDKRQCRNREIHRLELTCHHADKTWANEYHNHAEHIVESKRSGNYRRAFMIRRTCADQTQKQNIDENATSLQN